jgi:hypothetical protein
MLRVLIEQWSVLKLHLYFTSKNIKNYDFVVMQQPAEHHVAFKVREIFNG